MGRSGQRISHPSRGANQLRGGEVRENIQGPAEVVWLGGYVDVSHEMDSNLNISPKMSYGVLECDIVMLQNYMLMIL